MYYIFLDTSEHNIKQLRKHGFTGPRGTMAPYLCIALCEPKIYRAAILRARNDYEHVIYTDQLKELRMAIDLGLHEQDLFNLLAYSSRVGSPPAL